MAFLNAANDARQRSVADSPNAAMLNGLQRAYGADAEAQQDVHDVRASLPRDYVYEALAPGEGDSAAARLSLRNDDDAGTRCHLKRIVACVKATTSTFHELEVLNAETSLADARAA